MNLVTYVNSSDERTINKTITQKTSVTVVMREDSSIIKPVFCLTGGADEFAGTNYVYAEDFGRYYYIDDIETDGLNMVILRCRVDVLMSNAEAINALIAVIERNTGLYNLYMDDGSFKVYQQPHVLTREFPNGFSSPSFVLAVAGAA